MRVKTKKSEPEGGDPVAYGEESRSSDQSDSNESVSLVDVTDEESQSQESQSQESQSQESQSQESQSQETYEENEGYHRGTTNSEAGLLRWIFSVLISIVKWLLEAENSTNRNEETIIRELANMDLRKDRDLSLEAFDEAYIKLGDNPTFQVKLIHLAIARAGLLIQTFEDSTDQVQDLLDFALKGNNTHNLEAGPIYSLRTIIQSYRLLQAVCHQIGVELCSLYHYIHMTEVQRLASFFVVSWENLRLKDSSIEDFLRVNPPKDSRGVQNVQWPSRSMLTIFNEYLSVFKKPMFQKSTGSYGTGKYLGRLASIIEERTYLLVSDTPVEILLENFGVQSLQAHVNFFSSSQWHILLLDWMADHFRTVVEIEGRMHSSRPAKEMVLRLSKGIRRKNPIAATASIHGKNTYYQPYVIFLRFLASLTKCEGLGEASRITPSFAVRLVLKSLYDGPVSVVPAYIYFEVINSCYAILPVNLEPPNEENLYLKARLDCLYRHLILIQEFPLEGIGITFATLKRATEDQTSARKLIRAIFSEIPINQLTITRKVEAIHRGIGSSLLKEEVIKMTVSYLIREPEFTTEKEESFTKSVKSLVKEWNDLPSLNPKNNDRAYEIRFFFLEEIANMFLSTGNVRPYESDQQLANARCALKFASVNFSNQSKLFEKKLRSLETFDVLMDTLTNLRRKRPIHHFNVTSFHSFESLFKFFSFRSEKVNPTEAEELAIADCKIAQRVPILTRESGIDFVLVIALEWPQLAKSEWEQMTHLLQKTLLVKDDETCIMIRIFCLYEIHENFLKLNNFEASKEHLLELCNYFLVKVKRAMERTASNLSRDRIASANAVLIHPDILGILKKCVDCPYGKDLKQKTREFCENIILDSSDSSDVLDIVLDLATPDLKNASIARQLWSEDVLDESLIQQASLHNLTTFLCLESAIKHFRSEQRDQRVPLMCVAVVKELDNLCSTKEIKKIAENRFNQLMKCPLFPNINPQDVGNLLHNLRTTYSMVDEEIIFIGCWRIPERITPFLELLSAARSIRIAEDQGPKKFNDVLYSTNNKVQDVVKSIFSRIF